MLVLTRRLHQSIQIGEDIEIMVSEIRSEGGSAQVHLAVRAPRSVPVHRKEVYEAIQAENRAAASSDSEMPPT